MAEEQMGKLSERNRRFMEDWKKAREEDRDVSPEELTKRRQKAQEIWDELTLGGLIE